tara:strand:- start:132 stop:431 length:300 start_codon:yes stop_codon:yes gene_type:complete
MLAKAAKSVDAIERVSAVRYDDLPCVPMYFIKQEQEGKSKGYFSLFLDKPSINVPHFEVNHTEQGLFVFLESYLKNKWERNSKDSKKWVDLSALASTEA